VSSTLCGAAAKNGAAEECFVVQTRLNNEETKEQSFPDFSSLVALLFKPTAA
jgi:hypothetical protein